MVLSATVVAMTKDAGAATSTLKKIGPKSNVPIQSRAGVAFLE